MPRAGGIRRGRPGLRESRAGVRANLGVGLDQAVRGLAHTGRPESVALLERTVAVAPEGPRRQTDVAGETENEAGFAERWLRGGGQSGDLFANLELVDQRDCDSIVGFAFPAKRSF